MKISETHSRGLRKDLFHVLSFPNESGLVKTLNVALRHALMPMPSARIQRDAFNRARKALKTASMHFEENLNDQPPVVLGQLLLPGDRVHLDGGTEQVICIHLHVILDDVRLIQSHFIVASIGQHAIERMFQRLCTSNIVDVMVEIASALRFLGFLYPISNSKIVTPKYPSQLVVPTKHGAFLCRSLDGQSLDVRTFIATNFSDRIEASIQGAKRSYSQFINNPADRMLLTILASDPTNWWWDRRET